MNPLTFAVSFRSTPLGSAWYAWGSLGVLGANGSFVYCCGDDFHAFYERGELVPCEVDDAVFLVAEDGTVYDRRTPHPIWANSTGNPYLLALVESLRAQGATPQDHVGALQHADLLEDVDNLYRTVRPVIVGAKELCAEFIDANAAQATTVAEALECLYAALPPGADWDATRVALRCAHGGRAAALNYVFASTGTIFSSSYGWDLAWSGALSAECPEGALDPEQEQLAVRVACVIATYAEDPALARAFANMLPSLVLAHNPRSKS